MRSCRIYGEPVPQGSSRAFNHSGRIVVTSDNPKLKKWRTACTLTMRLQMLGASKEKFDGPVEVSLVFYIARPKSHFNGSGSLRKGYSMSHVSKPDLDKLVRAVLDAATDAGLWHDDAQVVRLTATKNYAADGELPGVRVEVWKVGQE